MSIAATQIILFWLGLGTLGVGVYMISTRSKSGSEVIQIDKDILIDTLGIAYEAIALVQEGDGWEAEEATKLRDELDDIMETLNAG